MRFTRRQAVISASAAAMGFVAPSWIRASALRAEVPAMHGIAMHGDLKYGPDFQSFDYVNLDAPKAGTLRQEASGTFDSFNAFIIRGNPAAGIGMIYDSLLTSAFDEPFSEYGVLAETVEMPEDRSLVRFNMRDNARWHDGVPVTVDDVIFSLNILREQGAPFYRQYYANVASVEQTGDNQVSFIFDGTVNRELPLILGQLTILPKHYYDDREFDQSSLDIPLGSGPYKIKRFEAGRFIEYERVQDYWGADIPVNRGRYNFDTVRFDYFRDRDVSLEAFKSGEFDLFVENSAKRWATGYDIAAVNDGRIIKEEVPDTSTAVMQGMIFNIRKPLFQDKAVREAIGYAFDFEWMNKTLFYGQYERCYSYFSGSEYFAARELPDERELAILEPFRDQLPEEVFTTIYEPPTSDGSGENRRNLRSALRMLGDAGFELVDDVMTHKETGQKLEFEYLYLQPSSERIAQPFAQALAKIGVVMTLRRVDTAQYVKRVEDFDFDMITAVWGQSLSPGNEQREYWGTAAADQPGSRNRIGIKSPVVDAVIDSVIQANTREDLEAACRALDRVLIWEHYLVPQFFNRVDRISRWSYVIRPDVTPLRGLDLMSWWYDEARAEEIGRG